MESVIAPASKAAAAARKRAVTSRIPGLRPIWLPSRAYADFTAVALRAAKNAPPVVVAIALRVDRKSVV